MGLDYGTRRIGVALSDPLKITAQPHTVIDAQRTDLGSEIRRLADEHSVELIVIGLPLNLKGQETASAAAARRLADLVEEETGLPVQMVDERFTTKTAEAALIAGDVRRKRRREVVDQVAAAVMLQSFLDGRR
jgi:putative Holliday junction resolvase